MDFDRLEDAEEEQDYGWKRSNAEIAMDDTPLCARTSSRSASGLRAYDSGEAVNIPLLNTRSRSNV